jgi:glycosyltransferase involved in cell wall biosynthesis
MLQDQLKIGTITACYNAGKFFLECLDGLLNQTRPINIATVIDDGSTDNSVQQIVAAINDRGGKWLNPNISFNQPNTAIIKNTSVVLLPQMKNKGPAAARNIGLQYLLNAVELICVADCDDILYPTKIEKSVEIFKKYPHVGLVYSDYDTFTAETGETKREFKEPFNYRRLVDECIVSNNSMYPASIIKATGFYDESLFGPEDYDLWLRISEVASVYHIPEALYKYHLTGNNITITTPSERFAQHVMRVKQKIMERRNASR